MRRNELVPAAIRAEETAKGGIKYELVLSEPSVNDPPKKDQITSPPKTMSVEEIEQKLKAAEERRLVSTFIHEHVYVIKKALVDQIFKAFGFLVLEYKKDILIKSLKSELLIF
ncbi:uncharacterized protein TNIN_405181 [Trichonephila inaurata madagascariensis]|uniref:Stathmin n=1 Tax=Trichonephila inaurata madagascariensis TaxID=2747483 RepID=A0A8X7CGW4_9ARAC|nr:uncharacterized protein TNIN_405181 [Trichonephila inaurata madagascariensis]